MLGIRTGRLGEIMEWFLHHVRRQIDLRRRCRAALIYPVALLTCGLLAAVGGLIFIVPDLVSLYKSSGFEDAPALELLDVASFVVRNYGYWILAGVLTVIVGVPLLLYAFGGKVLLHRCLAGIPFVGMMFRCSGLASFCELLAMFVSGQLPLAEGIRLAARGTADADLDERFECWPNAWNGVATIPSCSVGWRRSRRSLCTSFTGKTGAARSSTHCGVGPHLRKPGPAADHAVGHPDRARGGGGRFRAAPGLFMVALLYPMIRMLYSFL